VDGKRRPDLPIFILISGRTFSGGEEFAYNFKTRKRATLIGETTGGGANPGGMYAVNEALAIFIPTGRAINPVTKTNWEGSAWNRTFRRGRMTRSREPCPWHARLRRRTPELKSRVSRSRSNRSPGRSRK